MRTINCAVCGIEFEANSNSHKYCSECAKEREREYGKEYHKRPKYKRWAREYYRRPEIKKRKREWEKKSLERPEVKKKRKERMRKFCQRPENKKKRREYARRPEVKKKVREHRQRPEVRKRICEYMKKRRATDKNYALRDRLRTLLAQALRLYTKTGKILSSRKYGVDYQAIIEHLKPFPENLKDFHIDHIRPLSSFDLSNPEQVKEAFAPSNHQWLLAKDNLSKSAKLDWKKSN